MRPERASAICRSRSTSCYRLRRDPASGLFGGGESNPMRSSGSAARWHVDDIAASGSGEHEHDGLRDFRRGQHAPGVKAVAAMTPSIAQPISLDATAISLRRRKRSTSGIAGNYGSCVRNGSLASNPTMAVEAPRCSAKAVRMTPVVRAAAPPPRIGRLRHQQAKPPVAVGVGQDGLRVERHGPVNASRSCRCPATAPDVLI